jgi:hypothetical protein
MKGLDIKKMKYFKSISLTENNGNIYTKHPFYKNNDDSNDIGVVMGRFFEDMSNMREIFGDLILHIPMYCEFIFNDIENSLIINLIYNNNE